MEAPPSLAGPQQEGIALAPDGIGPAADLSSNDALPATRTDSLGSSDCRKKFKNSGRPFAALYLASTIIECGPAKPMPKRARR